MEDPELEKIKIIFGVSWPGMMEKLVKAEKGLKEKCKKLDEAGNQLNDPFSASLRFGNSGLEALTYLKTERKKLDNEKKIVSDFREALSPENWDLLCPTEISNRIIKFYEYSDNG
jgi:hypothetical protein